MYQYFGNNFKVLKRFYNIFSETSTELSTMLNLLISYLYYKKNWLFGHK